MTFQQTFTSPNGGNVNNELIFSYVRSHHRKPIGAAVIIRGGIVDVVFSGGIFTKDRRTRVKGISFGVVRVPGLAEAIAGEEELDTIRGMVKAYVEKDLKGVHRRVEGGRNRA